MKRSALLVSSLLAACAPDLPDDAAIVSAPRIVAVKADPAEAKPDTAVTYTALIASPPKADSNAIPTWAFCTAAKPPTEDNAVSDACLGGGTVAPAGSGSSIVATTPGDACSVFGPDTPPGDFRPRDPDVTGGYYQPLRVSLAGGAPSFAFERLDCGLGMASADIATAFATEYVPNGNPTLLPLSASVAGSETALDAIPVNARVTLRASWPPQDAETYAYFDRQAQSVVAKRESMRVAWYATGGRFDAVTTGRDESDVASNTTNVWTAPGDGGAAVLWIVLQDSRGGVDFARYDASVTP